MAFSNINIGSSLRTDGSCKIHCAYGREGPRGGIVILVYGLMNLAAPYLCSYDVKHLFYGWHALLLKVHASLIPRREPGDVI